MDALVDSLNAGEELAFEDIDDICEQNGWVPINEEIYIVYDPDTKELVCASERGFSTSYAPDFMEDRGWPDSQEIESVSDFVDFLNCHDFNDNAVNYICDEHGWCALEGERDIAYDWDSDTLVYKDEDGYKSKVVEDYDVDCPE